MAIFRKELLTYESQTRSGFVGSRQNIRNLQALILGEFEDVSFAISGMSRRRQATLAYNHCVALIGNPSFPITTIIWIHKTEEALSLIGVEAAMPLAYDPYSTNNSLFRVYACEIPESISAWYDIDSHPSGSKNGECLLIVDDIDSIQERSMMRFIKKAFCPRSFIITNRDGLEKMKDVLVGSVI